MHETIWWLVLCFWNLVWTWSRLVKIELLSEQQVTWECRYLKRRQRSLIESKNKRWRVFFSFRAPNSDGQMRWCFLSSSFKGQTLADPSCSSDTNNTLHWPDRWRKSLLCMIVMWVPYTNLSVGLYTACLLRPQPHRERLAWTWCLLSPNLRPHQLLGRLFVHRPFLVPLSS